MTDIRLTLRGLHAEDARPLGRRFVAQLREDDVPSLAAGVAFRIFLSLFPALFAVVAVFGLVVDQRDIVGLLEAMEFIPGEVRSWLAEQLTRFMGRAREGAQLTLVAGTLGGLWAASSAAVMLARALTRIYGYRESRGFVHLRVTGVVIAFALFGALVALMLLLVAGRGLQAWALDALALAPEVEATLGVLLTVGRLLLAILVLVVLFAFVYWIGPDRAARPPFQWITPGAVVAVVGWIALSALFNVYTRVAGENEVYGALGGVIVLLLWLQFSMAALFAGAELNAVLRRVAVARPAVERERSDVAPAQ